MKKGNLTPAEEMAFIKSELGHNTYDRPVMFWLDTKNPRLNGVLGSEQYGLAYGRMIEVYGPNSHGKTMISLLIAALAQADGAKVAWVDLERSYDEQWVREQGVDPAQIYLFKLETGTFGDEKEEREEYGQELFERVELWMKRRNAEDRDSKLLVVVDSLASILTKEEAEAGLTKQNMRTNASLPAFLSKFLRRWASKVANYNAMVILINQIRATMNPYGDPVGAPGGNATKHYCSVRATVRRVKGGRLMQNKQVVGLRGVIKNIKNKVGGGSREGMEAGFQTIFGKQQWKFTTVNLAKKDLAEEGEDEP